MDQEQNEIRYKDKQYVAYLVITILFTISYYELFWGRTSNQLVKGMVGGLMLLSELLLIILAVRSYRVNWQGLNFWAKLLIGATIVYNVLHILYAAVLDDEVAYFTFFGNPVFQPAFMLPITILLGLSAENFFSLFKSFWRYVVVAGIICLLRLYVNQFEGVLLLFLIGFAAYMPPRKRFALFVLAIIYAVFCYAEDARMAVMRTIVGGVVFVASYFSLWRYQKLLKVVFVISAVVPFYFMALFVKTGYSVFEHSEATSRISQLGADDTGDTRTFLYEELFEDLTENNAWVLGKGINGTYYSSYFDQKNVEADVAERKGLEVGFLNYILKGGIVQAVLYLLLLLWSSYNCLFRSNSKAVMLIGVILLAHFLFLFVEEVPRYDLYNIAMWFCIGMGFSDTVLEWEDDYFENQIMMS